MSLMCFDVLKEFQGLQVRIDMDLLEIVNILIDLQAQSLQSQGITISDTFLIAVINNCQQCSVNAEQMKDQCIDYLQSEIEGTDLEGMLYLAVDTLEKKADL